MSPRGRCGQTGVEIIIGFADPAAEAKAIGIKKAAAAEVAAKELREVLNSMLTLYGD